MSTRDIEAVAAIEATAYSHPVDARQFHRFAGRGYLAEVLVDQRPASSSATSSPCRGVDELHLLNVTVAPAWQCRGHGQYLLQAVLALAGQRRLASVWLEVRQGNLRAQALYRRLGFAESGVRRGYYPRRLDARTPS
jgi:ribosomal-protein-alanine N-acetyltransferase